MSEARDRCRTAIVNSQFEWPATRRVTILLSPADLPKRGPHLDLAIAVAVVRRERRRPTRQSSTAGSCWGSSPLDGRLRAVRGVLPMVMAARNRGLTCVIVPEVHVEEASMVPGMEVIGVRSLAQAVAVLRTSRSPRPRRSRRSPRQPAQLARGPAHRRARPRRRARHGRRALRARGRRPPAATTCCSAAPRARARRRSPSGCRVCCPDLTVEERLELSAVHSLSGDLPPSRSPVSRPPFRAPHHSATKASVLGGGTGRVHPGRDQPGAARRAVPRRVPAVHHRHHRVAASAARARRGDDRPR